MRYLTAACPAVSRVLLIESGSRAVLEAAIPQLRRVLGSEASFDLITCFAGSPSTLDASARVWRTQDYGGPGNRAQLARELRAASPSVLAIVCSGESIMLRWKWWLAWSLPAKILIVNENADCFWFDTSNLRIIRRLLLVRLGLSGGGAGRTARRLAMLPFVTAYLVLYAIIVHARRTLRMTFAHRR